MKEGQALGIIIIVDELGKLLEHAALQPEESDLHILQEMAEAASRSYEYPIWFITILHQEFSQYASRLGRRHQREWSKIQQRFFDVPCTLDDTDALQLVATALNSSTKATVYENAHIQEAVRACAKFAPKGSEVEFQKVCVSSYPSHPSQFFFILVAANRPSLELGMTAKNLNIPVWKECLRATSGDDGHKSRATTNVTDCGGNI
ncbi:unnamed protein product [marine sediment metagenome]|uniref:Uncharacterized protein n=1 Tax=marine sediment metagenome TaxID=412755 RepID=X1RQ47_9ZZZZ